jgi:high affinity Mn2+ porin
MDHAPAQVWSFAQQREVDQTFAGGLGANGAMWHRRYDRAGLAFVSNAISKDHQTYLADGGYGFLIGDGALN